MDWKLILDYGRALIWPLTIGFSVVWLRGSIKRFIAEIVQLRIKVGPLGLATEQRQRNAEQAIESATIELAKSARASGNSAKAEGAGEQRLAELEVLIRTSTAYGWEMGLAGNAVPETEFIRREDGGLAVRFKEGKKEVEWRRLWERVDQILFRTGRAR